MLISIFYLLKMEAEARNRNGRMSRYVRWTVPASPRDKPSAHANAIVAASSLPRPLKCLLSAAAAPQPLLIPHSFVASDIAAEEG